MALSTFVLGLLATMAWSTLASLNVMAQATRHDPPSEATAGCPGNKGCTQLVRTAINGPEHNSEQDGVLMYYESLLWGEFWYGGDPHGTHNFLWCRHTVLDDLEADPDDNPDLGIPRQDSFNVSIDPVNNPHWSPIEDLHWPNNRDWWSGRIDLWENWSDQTELPHDCQARAKSHTYAKRGWDAVSATHIHNWVWVKRPE